MTVKQRIFCEEYLIDLNATQAAIRSGYSPTSAKQIGTENLTKPSIRACIDRALAERSKRTGVTADRVIRELARVAFLNAPSVVDVESGKVLPNASPDDTAAISAVKVKTIPLPDGTGIEREIRFADKLKALELLGKHLGMYTDNVNVSGDMGVQILNDIPKDA